MLLLAIFLVCGLISVAFANLVAVSYFVIFAVFAAIFLAMTGAFTKCTKCGSRLTGMKTPEYSRDTNNGRIHEYSVQKCWNPKCLETQSPGSINVKPTDKEEA